MRTYFGTSMALTTLMVFGGLALGQETTSQEAQTKTTQPPSSSVDKSSADKSSAGDKANSGDKAQVAISHNFKSGDLIGLAVRNKTGEDIGRVNDIVVDLKSGDVRYVAVQSGAVAGLGGKMHAVPWNAMTFRMGQPNDADARFFVFDATKEQLDQAKGFDTSHWPNIADAQWARTAGSTNQPKTESAPGERPNVAYETVFRASKIDGMDVRNNANEDLGSIDEVMIDVTKGTVKYLILSHGTLLTGGNKLFAIPLSQITLAHANNETFVKFNVSQEQLANAPGFGSNRWPSTSDTWWRDVDTHYERSARRDTTTRP
jgi:sporulation protein YlmC with PRC-barrel domain